MADRPGLREQLAKARRRYRDAKQEKADTKPHSDRRKKLARLVRFYRDRKDRLVARLDKRRHHASEELNLALGAPSWGGSDQVLERVAVPKVRELRGVDPNSAKRSESYGNPGSDHHTSQTNASARDWPIANDYSTRNAVMRAYGVEAVIHDYGNYYIYVDGTRFRLQPIAGTHGTGPHFHLGARRA